MTLYRTTNYGMIVFNRTFAEIHKHYLELPKGSVITVLSEEKIEYCNLFKSDVEWTFLTYEYGIVKTRHKQVMAMAERLL